MLWVTIETVQVHGGKGCYTNCIFNCAESAFKYLQWLMPIHYQSALYIKRILIRNRYYKKYPVESLSEKGIISEIIQGTLQVQQDIIKKYYKKIECCDE